MLLIIYDHTVYELRRKARDGQRSFGNCINYDSFVDSWRVTLRPENDFWWLCGIEEGFKMEYSYFSDDWMHQISLRYIFRGTLPTLELVFNFKSFLGQARERMLVVYELIVLMCLSRTGVYRIVVLNIIILWPSVYVGLVI